MGLDKSEQRRRFSRDAFFQPPRRQDHPRGNLTSRNTWMQFKISVAVGPVKQSAPEVNECAHHPPGARHQAEQQDEGCSGHICVHCAIAWQVHFNGSMVAHKAVSKPSSVSAD